MTDTRSRAAAAKKELTETEKAFAAIRLAMIDKLIATQVSQTLEREKLYLGVNALDAMREALMAVVDSGRIEDAADAVKAAYAPRDMTRSPFSRSA